GATGYTVLRADGPACVGDLTPVAQGWDDTSFDDLYPESLDPADPNHTYAYTVYATNGDGTSGPSPCIPVTYDTLKPVIGDLSATPQADGSIALSWAVSDLHGPIALALRRGAPNEPAPSSITDGVAACDTPAGTTSCTDAAVVSGAQYSY